MPQDAEGSITKEQVARVKRGHHGYGRNTVYYILHFSIPSYTISMHVYYSCKSVNDLNLKDMDMVQELEVVLQDLFTSVGGLAREKDTVSSQISNMSY
jgi:hypothetical protein